jgi:hypothetical protein
MSLYPRVPIPEEKFIAAGFSPFDVLRVRLIERCDRAWTDEELAFMQSVWGQVA